MVERLLGLLFFDAMTPGAFSALVCERLRVPVVRDTLDALRSTLAVLEARHAVRVKR